MKHPPAVYSDFGNFLARAIEVAKERIGVYNLLLDTMTRKRLESKGLNTTLDIETKILRQVGWEVLVTITVFLSLGFLGFYSSIGALIAINPILAAILVAAAGGDIYIIWQNRKFVRASKKVGDRYKKDFDEILSNTPNIAKKAVAIEKLLDRCVISLCTEAFQISSDEFRKKLESELNVSEKVPILFLASEPSDASRLRLGEEVREIQEKLQFSKLREEFILHQRMAVRPQDLSQALLDVNPLIVHFSGHGTSYGELCLEAADGKTRPIEPEALSSLFEQFNNIYCVVLNACYSEIQAEVIVKHISYVIGMSKAIGDKAAIAFAIGFYQALGAGRTIEEAFKLACVQISLQGIPEHLTPKLICNSELTKKTAG